MHSNKRRIILIVVIAICCVFRLTWINADPPANLDRDYLTDEGWWAHNARSYILFDSLLPDEFNVGAFASSAYTALLISSYSIGGVSISTTRVLIAICGILTILSLAWLLLRYIGFNTAVAGIVLWGLDYFVIQHNRVGFLEALPTALIALSLVTVNFGRKGEFGAGILSAIALFAKSNSVFLLPVTPLSVIATSYVNRLGKIESPSIRTTLFTFFSGFLITVSFFALFFIQFSWNDFVSTNAMLAMENRLSGWQIYLNAFSIGIAGEARIPVNGAFIAQCIGPTAFFFVWLLLTARTIAFRGLRFQIQRLTFPEISALTWLALMILALISTKHTQDRRLYPLAFPFAILAARAITLSTINIPRQWNGSQMNKLVMILALLLPAVFYLRASIGVLIQQGTRHFAFGAQLGLSKHACCLFATIVIIAIFTPIAWIVVLHTARYINQVRIGAILVVLCLVITHHARWISNITFDAIECQEKIGRLVDNARVVGGRAPSLLFSTHAKTLVLLDKRWVGYGILNKNTLPKFRPSYCLVEGRLLGSKLDYAVMRYLNGWGAPIRSTVYHYQIGKMPDGTPRFQGTLCRIMPLPPPPFVFP